MFWQVSAHGIFIKVLVNAEFQENQKQYPTIFSLALDILLIQDTSVPSEHIFSSAKETDTLQCNQLGLDSMEALQMLKFLITKGRGLSFMDGLDEALQIQEIEELMDQQMLIPEDMQACIKHLAL